MHHMTKYTQLQLSEWELIFLYLNQGKTLREIGRLLHRHHVTIAREIERNQKGGNDEKVLAAYTPTTAQARAETRRSQAKIGLRKLDEPALKRFGVKKLGQGWSPEQIADRLRLKAPNLNLSQETIYLFIYAKENGRLRLFELLRKRHPRRQHKYGRRFNNRFLDSSRSLMFG